MMRGESPRALLRSFLESAFSDSFKLFIRDHFNAAFGKIGWGEGLTHEVEGFLVWLEQQGRIAEIWPVLERVRPARHSEILELASEWNAAGSGRELHDWLTQYARHLVELSDTQDPAWPKDLAPIDLAVRERSIGEPGVGRLVGSLDRALATADPRVVLVGDGGAGKTTLLIRLAATMATAAVDDPAAPIPLYMSLNSFDARDRALDGLLDELARSCGCTSQALREIWHGQRPCWALLDGLNEVRSEYGSSCLSAIAKLMPRRGQHRCIVTSRFTADVEALVRRIGPAAPATILELVPLTESQIRTVLGRRGLTAVADRVRPRIVELARTPSLIGAIIQICEGGGHDNVPVIAPQLYRMLIDDYLFRRRELQKPDDARPTTYDYERVKQPVLAQLALTMLRTGVTRVQQDMDLLKAIHAQLDGLRETYDGKVTVMPREPDCSKLLDEVVLNGILRRRGPTLEFWHESVLDYYAGIALGQLSASEIAALVSPLVWRRVSIGTDELRLPGGSRKPLQCTWGYVMTHPT